MKSDGRLSSLLLSHDHLYYTQQLLLRDDTIRRGMLSGWEISISFERVYTTECVPLPFSFIHPLLWRRLLLISIAQVLL